MIMLLPYRWYIRGHQHSSRCMSMRIGMSVVPRSEMVCGDFGSGDVLYAKALSHHITNVTPFR